MLPQKCLQSAEFEAYLNGDIADKQKELSIDQHITECPLCYDAMEGYALLYEKQNQKTPIRKFKPIKPNTKWVKWAAAAILLPAIGGYGISIFKDKERQGVFSSYYGLLEDISSVTMRGGEAALIDATKTSTDSALDAYNADDFERSFTELSAIAKADPKNLKATLFAGCSAMELNKYDEAAKLLAAVHDAPLNSDQDLFFQQNAVWYLALVKIKQNDLVRATDFLNEIISDPTNPWNEKAKQALNDLIK